MGAEALLSGDVATRLEHGLGWIPGGYELTDRDGFESSKPHKVLAVIGVDSGELADSRGIYRPGPQEHRGQDETPIIGIEDRRLTGVWSRRYRPDVIDVGYEGLAGLFDRQGQRAVLTEAGRELLEGGRHVLRAAHALESRVKRVATGWEAELCIAIDGIIPVTDFLPIIEAFYAAGTATQIRLLAEVYGGCWDALMGGRADLVIGAPGEGPPGGGYATFLLGTVEWVFAVAPDHPLARAPGPLKGAEIAKYRAVAGRDTSRYLPARTSGIYPGQDVLTVPCLEAKIEAQCRGLGVGFLPRCRAERALACGRLVICTVEEPKPEHQLWMAWRTERLGGALSWFIEHSEVIKSLLACL